MIIEGGYTLNPRRVYDDPLYKEMQEILRKRKPTIGLFRFHAMQDLFRRAQFADSGLKTENQYIVVKRGQLFISVEKLANEWGWSRHKVYDFLAFLEQERDTIRTQKFNRGILVTIVNYEEYQNPKNYKTNGRDTKRTREGHDTDTSGTHNNEGNKGNEGNEEREKKISDDAAEIKDHWNAKGKTRCLKYTDTDRESITSWLNVGIEKDEIKKGVDNYDKVRGAPPGTYKWTWTSWSMREFMRRGLERFMSDDFMTSITIKKTILGAWDGSEKGERVQ